MAAVTTTTTITSSQETPSTGAQIFNAIYEIGVSTGAGALAGYFFTIINPVGGAIFGASCALTRTIGGALIDRFVTDPTLKVAAYAVSFIASIAAGIFVATTAGFPLTVMGSVGMLLAMLVTTCAIRCVTGGAGSCSSALGGAGLALKERFC
jgi:hypothetical protein